MTGEATVKRPGITKVAIALHLLAGIALVSLSVYLIWLAGTPEILSENDAADTVQGLKVGALALVVPGLLWMVGAWAMWRRHGWGWWLALANGAGMASILVYSAIADGWGALDAEDATVSAIFVVLPLLLLFPRVRQYCAKSHKPSSEAETTGMPQLTL